MSSQKNSIHKSFLLCFPFPEFSGEFYLPITSTHNATESFWNTSLLYKWISKTIYTTILQIVKDRHYSFPTLSNTYWACESESESRSVTSNSLGPHGLYSPWNSPDQNTGVSNLSLLQGILPTQGSNPGLPHCRRFYQLSHKGSPRILEWVAYPFSSRSSLPRNLTGVPALQVDGFFTNWAIREALTEHIIFVKCARH